MRKQRLIMLLLVALLVISTLVSCAPKASTGASEADTAPPKASVVSAKPMPTAKPTSTPSLTQAFECTISMEKERYPRGVKAVAFTLHVPEGIQALGSNTPGIERSVQGKWEWVPLMYKDGMLEQLEDGQRFRVSMSGEPHIEAGLFRAYIDVLSEIDSENPSRLYAYFSLTEGTVAFMRPDTYAQGTDKITIVIDNTQNMGRVVLDDISISKVEGRDWIGYGGGEAEGSVNLAQGVVQQLDVVLDLTLTEPGVYHAELRLTRSDWGGEPFTEYRAVMFVIE